VSFAFAEFQDQFSRFVPAAGAAVQRGEPPHRTVAIFDARFIGIDRLLVDFERQIVAGRVRFEFLSERPAGVDGNGTSAVAQQLFDLLSGLGDLTAAQLQNGEQAFSTGPLRGGLGALDNFRLECVEPVLPTAALIICRAMSCRCRRPNSS